MPLAGAVVPFGIYHATPVATAVWHHYRPFLAGVADTVLQVLLLQVLLILLLQVLLLQVLVAVAVVADHAAAAGIADTAAARTAAAAGQIFDSPVRSVGAVPSPCPHRHHP